MSTQSVNIIGAGQCGTLMAIMLARHGFDVNVFERFRDPRIQDAEAGRSINLALAARGLNALQQVGIDSLIKPLMVPMRGRMVHQQDGRFHRALLDLVTNRVHVLTSTELDESPSIAPNGSMVLYATKHADRGILAAVSVDGGVKFRLPSREGDVREPAWSPYMSR